MAIDVIREQLEIVQGAGGPKLRIAGSRTRVLDVVIWHERLGMSSNEIVAEFPTITRADVHAALAYYWDHRDEIEAAIQREHDTAEEFRKRYPSLLDEKLKKLRGE